MVARVGVRFSAHYAGWRSDVIVLYPLHPDTDNQKSE